MNKITIKEINSLTSTVNAKIRQNSIILSLFSTKHKLPTQLQKDSLSVQALPAPFLAGVRVCSHKTGWMGVSP